jgi:hypothetical protein
MEAKERKIVLEMQALEERIAPSTVKGGFGGNPHDAPPGQGNWVAGRGNPGEGDG